MTYPVISKHFRYFFKCLQIQVEETYFFHEALVIFTLRDWTCKQKYNWKIFIFCPFLLLFHYFKLFHIFSSFFHFMWKKPISSSKPSPFPGNNEHVNSNATVKYWYSAQLCCCFISHENYNFLQEKILPTRYSSIFKHFFNLYPGFFQFKWKKPISSRLPAQFLVSLPLEGTAIKYLYSAYFWLLFH